ncbi:hypothetical protein EII20_04845 [Comamonadaceae bacterium OH2545_COT-014]|nr:hypothetical protein EII20_04845 [Comamonadaceae bacterium OH2545_COT-014]
MAFKAALAASLLLSLAATVPGLARPGPAAGALATAAPEWPTRWHDGQPLRPLALSAVEARFARGFPGHLARLTDGRRILVLRQVQRPTRMLHPAADCYRALGWRIEDEGLMQPAAASRTSPASPAPGDGLQRCFTARQGNTRLRVCEQIEDAAGRRFTDTSAWYWAAALGQSPGPWQATTVAQPL